MARRAVRKVTSAPSRRIWPGRRQSTIMKSSALPGFCWSWVAASRPASPVAAQPANRSVARARAVKPSRRRAGGAPSAAPAQPKRGGVLRVAERADPVGFDTLGKKKASVYTQLVFAYTHNRLFKYGPGGGIGPDLAPAPSPPTP